jgi:DNA gyrase/topoisomerase IV subunit B
VAKTKQMLTLTMSKDTKPRQEWIMQHFKDFDSEALDV